MKDFLTDEEMAKLAPDAAPDFISDEEMAKVAPVPAGPKTNAGEALLRGAAQGATLNFADEASARVNAVRDYLSAKLGLRGDIGWDDAVSTNLKAIRDRDKLAHAEHPVASTVGGVAGGLATAAIPGAGALNAGTKVGALARVGTAAGVGGLMGAGQSEHNPLASYDELKEFGGDVGKGAVIGGATQGLLDAVTPVVGKALGAIPDKLEGLANRRYAKAVIGNQQKVYDELGRKPGGIEAFGRDIGDSGIVKFGSNARAIAGRAKDAKDAAGDEIGQFLSSLDEHPDAYVDGDKVADQILALADKIRSPQNEATYKRLVKQADAFSEAGPMTFTEAQRLKNLYKFDPSDPTTMSLGKEATNGIKSALSKEMENGVSELGAGVAAAPAEALATGTGGAQVLPVEGQAIEREAQAVPGTLDDYLGLKRKYGTMATATKAAEKLANRQEKNATFGLLPTITGAAGAAAGIVHGSPTMMLMGPAAAVAHKTIQERGNAALAVSADKLADALKATPQVFGKYAGPLMEAAKRGNQSLAATHYMLDQTDSEYRQKNREIFGGSADQQ